MKRTLFFGLLTIILFVLPLFTFSTGQGDATALAAKTLSSVNLSGPYSVDEGTRTLFQVTAYYSDGTSEDVTATATYWDNSPYTNIWRGWMVVKVIPYTHTALLNASFTYNSVTKSDSQSVTIVKL